MSYTQLTDEETEKLANSLRYSKINTLNLAGNQLKYVDTRSKTTYSYLQTIRQSNVTSLDLSHNDFSNEMALQGIINHLANSGVRTHGDKGLSVLNIEDIKLDHLAVRKFLLSSNIPQINFEGNNFQEPWKSLYKLFLERRNVNLSEGYPIDLDLSNQVFNESDRMLLWRLLPYLDVRTLNLKKSLRSLESDKKLNRHFLDFQYYGWHAEPPERQNPTAIDLSDNNLEDSELTRILATLPWKSLVSLNLADNRIGKDGIGTLVQSVSVAEPVPEIQSYIYSLAYTQQPRPVRHITLPQIHHLNQLNLSMNRLTSNNLEILAKALPKCQMTRLDLWNNRLGNEGIRALVRTLSQTQIEWLNLGGNGIDDTGLEILARVLKESKIVELNLQINNIGSIGAQALARALQRIQVLNLSNNKIGNDGAKALAQALASPDCQLIKLDLGTNGIEKEGVEALAEILPYSRIRELNLGRSNIGDEEQQILRGIKERHPHIKISYY